MRKKFYLALLLFGVCNQSVAVEDNRVPFVFLNQYFSYDMLSSDKIVVSDKLVNFSYFSIDVGHKIVFVDLSKVAQFRFSNYSLILKDQNKNIVGKKVLPIAGPDSIGQKKYVFPATAASACIVSTNPFTYFEMCKRIVPDSSQISQIKIDGQQVENKSVVVLKDNEKPIVFEANLSAQNFVKLVTKKRLFYPKSIRKDVQQTAMKVKFIDTGLPVANNAWEDNVDVSWSSLNVPKDSILNLKQDIFFTNPNVQSVAIDYTGADLPVKQQAPPPEPVKLKTVAAPKPDIYIVPDHQYVIEPFTEFSGLKGDSPSIAANLASDLGKGLKFSYRKKMEDLNELQATFIGYQTSISSDVNQATINGSSQLLFSAGVGMRYSLTESIAVTPEFELEQDLFFKNTVGSSTIDIVNGLNKQFNVKPSWTFYSTKYSKASLDVGLSYILPTSASGLSVKSGYKYSYGGTYQYRFPEGALLLNAKLGLRKQDFEDVAFSENFLIMSAGYSFYFR